MRKVVPILLVGGLCAALAFVVGCDWSSGGDSGFNTSQGAGININFSGVYHGNLSGGKVVSNPSAGNITRLVIQQAGNTVEVTDNQGSTYRGGIGAPGTVMLPSGGTISSGQELVQAQISFKGQDNVSAREIEFVGVVHAVTVKDIQGETSKNTYESGGTDEQTYTIDEGEEIRTVTTLTIGQPGDPFHQIRTTTITYDKKTGREIDRKTEVKTERTTSSDYAITEANTQYRLEGTWIETGGGVSGVDALSAASYGIISTKESTEDTETL